MDIEILNGRLHSKISVKNHKSEKKFTRSTFANSHYVCIEVVVEVLHNVTQVGFNTSIEAFGMKHSTLFENIIKLSSLECSGL